MFEMLWLLFVYVYFDDESLSNGVIIVYYIFCGV